MSRECVKSAGRLWQVATLTPANCNSSRLSREPVSCSVVSAKATSWFDQWESVSPHQNRAASLDDSGGEDCPAYVFTQVHRPDDATSGSKGQLRFCSPSASSSFMLRDRNVRRAAKPGTNTPEASAACRKRKAIDGEDGAIGPAIGAAIKLYRLGLGGPQLIPAAAR